MNSLFLLFFIGLFVFAFGMNNEVFGSVTAGSNFCDAFPTHSECTGWRIVPLSDNFWFCEYVDLPTVCKNPPDIKKEIVPITGHYCCGIIGTHMPKNTSFDDVEFTNINQEGQSLDISSSNELLIWTERDYYSFGDRVNVYGKFNFNDPILKNNNPFVDVSINDQKVILDLPVHSNGWFAGYFHLTNPYLYYTGNNLISVTYFHTPTLQQSDKFAQSSYVITTGDIVGDPFFIDVGLTSGRISYEFVSEFTDPINTNFIVVRLTTPNGLVLPLPSLSVVDDLSEYVDISSSGQYLITATNGNYVTSQTFEYS